MVLVLEALRGAHPLEALNLEVLAAVPLGVLAKDHLVVKAVVLQGVVPAAAVGLDKITIIQTKVQQNVPLYQYLYPLVGGHIMVEAMVAYPYFHLSLN